ncbi:MAG: diguanylate cyclase [Gammaproteobacteria bacterium]|nr:diguanylate cyclase [Gammaproteobacteria bacterium]
MSVKKRNIVKWLIVLSLHLSTFGSGTHAAEDTGPVYVGVLAYRGIENALARWRPTVEFLQKEIPSRKFKIVPLSLSEMEMAVQNHSIDFLITNTGNYVYLEYKYGVSRIATLINKRLGKESTLFGAVIFTRADRNDIHTLKDLKGKSFLAVNEDGFGGFQMALREFVDQGVNPYRDFSDLNFSGFPQEKVAIAVINGEADAGTFRTDSLEQLAAEGKIQMDQIKILNAQSDENFPFAHSTRLYPEWPIAKLKHTSRELSREIAVKLMRMESNSAAAVAARSAGWTIPFDYQPVHELMRQLNVGPYKDLGKVTLTAVIREYGAWIVGVLLIGLVVSGATVYVIHLNRLLKRSNLNLQVQIKQTQSLTHQLEYQAMHDSLTGVSNRSAFGDYLEHELHRCTRYKQSFAVMILDLDDFKKINDNYGHYVGDCLLQAVSQRLLSVLRTTDRLARMGGDEFSLINVHIEKDEDTHIIAERIMSAFERPFSVDGQELKVGSSLGIAIFPQHGNDGVTLMRNADTAMYAAKRGKKGFAVYQIDF